MGRREWHRKTSKRSPFGAAPRIGIHAIAMGHPGTLFVVRYLTTNAKSNAYALCDPFALRYRRVNGGFLEIRQTWKRRKRTSFLRKESVPFSRPESEGKKGMTFLVDKKETLISL
jgi:hypothetical protein